MLLLLFFFIEMQYMETLKVKVLCLVLKHKYYDKVNE